MSRCSAKKRTKKANRKMINTQEYIEVILHIEPYTEESVEIIEAELGELPYDSFMEDQDPDGNPVLKAYIPKADYDVRALKLALEGVEMDVRFSATMIEPQNWNAQWESNFEPIFVDGKVTVKAPYHKDLPKTRFNITIDPQMAFGTGHHQTTYMMMQTMLENEAEIKGKVVMDMGCGTGVLAILGAKMGASKVYGVDIDAVAAQSAFENARRNKVSKKTETFFGDASMLQSEMYDVLLANIHRNIIIEDIHTYAGSLRRNGFRYNSGTSEGGLLMCSGFYDSDVEAIVEAAEKEGLSLVGSKSREGWACLLFRRFVIKKI